MADLKQIAEQGLALEEAALKDGGTDEAEQAYWDYVDENCPALARGYLSLLEENTRLREAAAYMVKIVDGQCKWMCEGRQMYAGKRRHAPECLSDDAEELREALGKREGTGEAKNG